MGSNKLSKIGKIIMLVSLLIFIILEVVIFLYISSSLLPGDAGGPLNQTLMLSILASPLYGLPFLTGLIIWIIAKLKKR